MIKLVFEAISESSVTQYRLLGSGLALCAMVFGHTATADGFSTDDLTTLNTEMLLAPIGLKPSITDRQFLTMVCSECGEGAVLALRLRDDFADLETAIRIRSITAETLMMSCTGTVVCLGAETQVTETYAIRFLLSDNVDWIAATVDVYAGGDALEVEVIGSDVDVVRQLAAEATTLLLKPLFP